VIRWGVFDSPAYFARSHIARSKTPPLFDLAYSLRCKFRRKFKLKNIFVGNLSFGTTEDTVRSMFEAYGQVDRVNIVTDRETGQARGFAFVEMSRDAEGDAAINGLNGKDLDGRTLNVNEARPKAERGSGGGGYRGNSGGGSRQRRW
jgi:cold-inducible RNA-binding protein